jgi:Ca2+-binding EF-hand superfamily protein
MSTDEAAKLFATLKHVLHFIDEDKSGTIDVSEFVTVYKKMHASASEADLESVFKAIDVNQDGSISQDELALYYGMRVSNWDADDGADVSGMSEQQKADLMALAEKATAA